MGTYYPRTDLRQRSSLLRCERIAQRRPIAGAGLPILAIGYSVYWLVRRRRDSCRPRSARNMRLTHAEVDVSEPSVAARTCQSCKVRAIPQHAAALQTVERKIGMQKPLCTNSRPMLPGSRRQAFRHVRQDTMARTKSAPRSPEHAKNSAPAPRAIAITLSVIILRSPLARMVTGWAAKVSRVLRDLSKRFRARGRDEPAN